MLRAMWPLHQGRPQIEIVLTPALGRQKMIRVLLADSGAGSDQAAFELVLDEDDCLLCNTTVLGQVQLAGAIAGSYPIYGIRVEIPQLGFDDRIRAVGVPTTPTGFDGIAGFRFLNRFGYGNFRNPKQFGIEL